MNCEGEGAPTRQNIKSHLQKYRLLMQKRARQQQATSQGGAAGAAGAVPEGGLGEGLPTAKRRKSPPMPPVPQVPPVPARQFFIGNDGILS